MLEGMNYVGINIISVFASAFMDRETEFGDHPVWTTIRTLYSENVNELVRNDFKCNKNYLNKYSMRKNF